MPRTTAAHTQDDWSRRSRDERQGEEQHEDEEEEEVGVEMAGPGVHDEDGSLSLSSNVYTHSIGWSDRVK